jgi:hypothetical protein
MPHISKLPSGRDVKRKCRLYVSDQLLLFFFLLSSIDGKASRGRSELDHDAHAPAELVIDYGASELLIKQATKHCGMGETTFDLFLAFGRTHP